MNGLGLDAGGSATRWALCDASGQKLAAGEVAAVSGHIFNESERQKMERVAAELHAAIGTVPVGRVVAGITGVSSTAPEARVAEKILAAALDIPPSAVQVQDDMWIAYHAAFAPGEGHVVYSGSGSVGIHVRTDGSTIRVGGRGMLIDDGGSAFWIGREALSLLYRHIDEDPDFDSPLAQLVFAACGGRHFDIVRAHVYGGGRTAVAQLARAVAAADDAEARHILHQAGRELARLALALVQRGGEKPIALLGRAVTLHPAIMEGFCAASPALRVELATPDASLAAARLAVRAENAQA